jgi:hypothetical protein
MLRNCKVYELFINPLLVIVWNWQQPRCLLVRNDQANMVEDNIWMTFSRKKQLVDYAVCQQQLENIKTE